MSKTLGRVAFDAFYAHLGLPADEVATDLKFKESLYAVHWQSAANAIIEECAKVADRHALSAQTVVDNNEGDILTVRHFEAMCQENQQVATAIRSLKTSTGEETANE